MENATILNKCHEVKLEMLFVAPEKSIHHGFSWFNLTKLRESVFGKEHLR